MRYGDFLGSLSLASSHSGGFPYSVEHMAGEGQPAQAARPDIVRVYGACAVCFFFFFFSFFQGDHTLSRKKNIRKPPYSRAGSIV